MDIVFPVLPTFCDSKGAIENVKHPTLKNKLKPVDIKSFYIRGCLQKGTIAVFKISGEVNPSDIGTKLLGVNKQILFGDFILNMAAF